MKFPKIKIIIRKDGSFIWFLSVCQNPNKEEKKSIEQAKESFNEISQDGDCFVFVPFESEIEIIKP